jgi:hypothetical protein
MALGAAHFSPSLHFAANLAGLDRLKEFRKLCITRQDGGIGDIYG